MSFYYLIASLPLLALNEKPSLTQEDYQTLCREQLSGRDAVAAERLASGPDYGDRDVGVLHPFVTALQARETQLRNASARIRAERRKADATDSLRPHTGFDTAIEEGVENAFALSTPLEREKALDRLRWNILDELAGVDPFSPSVALAYAVKLRLAWRWAALDADRAEAQVESVLNKAPSNDDGNIVSPGKIPVEGGAQNRG